LPSTSSPVRARRRQRLPQVVLRRRRHLLQQRAQVQRHALGVRDQPRQPALRHRPRAQPAGRSGTGTPELLSQAPELVISPDEHRDRLSHGGLRILGIPRSRDTAAPSSETCVSACPEPARKPGVIPRCPPGARARARSAHTPGVIPGAVPEAPRAGKPEHVRRPPFGRGAGEDLPAVRGGTARVFAA
jgi:hypothetical protein